MGRVFARGRSLTARVGHVGDVGARSLDVQAVGEEGVDPVAVPVSLYDLVLEPQRVGAAARNEGRVPLIPDRAHPDDGEYTVRGVHSLAEVDADLDRVAAAVGIAPGRGSGGDGDGFGVEPAVQPMPGLVRQAGEVRRHFGVRALDLYGAVAAETAADTVLDVASRHSESVGIQVFRLHRVAEDQGSGAGALRVTDPAPGVVTGSNSGVQQNRPVDIHGRAEGEGNGDGLPVAVGAVPAGGRGSDLHSGADGSESAVHLVA